jgi:membrane-bound serine protease (ClpP class)
MNARVSLWLWLILAAAIALVPGVAGAQDRAGVPVIELTGTIDPATEKWIGSALSDAAEDEAPLAIIKLDTPGGLDTSMREIIQDVIEAPMPVVVYVAPDGARAASAGAFITEAADVAAMAPATNIGSASAVTATGEDIEGTLGEKIENDAAAFIRALAESHGRDGALAERLVTEAENVTAQEALDQGLIDLIASDDEALLSQLDGLRVEGPKQVTLDTTGLELEQRDMPFQYEALQLLVNPTIAFLLLLVGLVGIAIELFSPGLILPGTLGAVSFVLGAFGSAQLPVTAVGIALLVLGIGLIVAEAQLPTGGVLGVGGVVALALSGLLLFDTDTDLVEVSVPVVITTAVLLGGFLVFASAKVVEAHRRPKLAGHEEMIGAVGDVRVPLDPVGQVFVHGALWRATAGDGATEAQRRRGARVRVESVEGLTLTVSPVPEEAEES